MDLQDIDGLDAKALQRLLAAGDQVCGTGIVAIGGTRRGFRGEADAGFRGDDHALAQTGIFTEQAAEDGFRASVAVNIRVIEERAAGVERGKDGGAHGLKIGHGIVGAGETPATEGQSANLERTGAER